MSNMKRQNGGDLCRSGGDLLNIHMKRQNGGDLRRRGGDLLNVHHEVSKWWRLIYVEEVGIY